jgi:DNA-binding NarL/FixJ family response regulator
MSIKVFLADDHAIIRDGLRALLEAKPGISVVGDASDGKQVLSQVNELQPDVVVMDILMPEINGIEATQKILETSPQVRVIILSMLGTADHVFRALRAGVRGFLLKESAGREVVDAVEAVYSGDMYFSGPIKNTLVNDYMQMR